MADTDPMLGRVLAERYRISRLLGRGGMGAVYVATQEPLGREVALKVLRPNLVDDAIAIERFKNEARVIAALHHPHIVAIHDSGATSDGVLFIAMEMLSGESLAARLKRTGRLPSAQAALIVRDVARALAAAHRRGVVHRDLKPDNIMLADAIGVGEQAKVLDFGIAKLVNEVTQQATLTGTGLVPGTPGYISPEQIAGLSADDPRSDLYALGVTWFEMLVGKRPFIGEHALQLFMRQLNEDVPRPSAAAPDAQISPAVDDLVVWLTHKDPAQRPASAEQLLERLAALAQGGALPAQLAHVAVATPASAPAIQGGLTSVQPMMAGATATQTGLAPGMQTGPPTGVQAATADATPMPPLRAASPAIASSTDAPPSATPHTGTNQPPTPAPVSAPGVAVAARGPSKRRALIAALAGVAVIAIGVRIATGGDAHELLKNDLEGAFDLPVHTTDPEAMRSMRDARASLRRGDLTTAARLADSVIETSADEPGAWLIKALVALHQEDWFETQRFSERAAATLSSVQDPAEAPAATELIELLRKSAKDKDPSTLATWRACAACGDFPIGDVAMARSAGLYEWRTLPDALETLAEAKKKDPGFVLVYLEEANLNLVNGDAAAALRAADEGLLRAPATPVLRLARAQALIAHGRLDDAEADIKLALAANPGIAADLLLARIAVLRDDERARLSILEGLWRLHARTPAAARIAIDHGEALVGAGRIDDAMALFEDASKGALAASQPEAAVYILLRASKVIGPAVRGDAPSIARLIAVAGDVLDEPQLPASPRNVLAAVKSLVDGAAVLERGDIDAARKRVAILRSIPTEYVAANLMPKVIVYLEMPLALRDQRWDDAYASSQVIDEVCLRHSAEAHVLATHAEVLHKAGDSKAQELHARAQTALAWIREHQWACRALGAQGAPVLSTMALTALIQHGAHDDAGAHASFIALQERFPHAHPDVRGVSEAMEVLRGGADMKKGAPVARPSPKPE